MSIMPIEATCPGCNEFFRLPDNLAGKQVSCQRCAKVWTVPQPTAPAAEDPEIAEAVDVKTAPAPKAPPTKKTTPQTKNAKSKVPAVDEPIPVKPKIKASKKPAE